MCSLAPCLLPVFISQEGKQFSFFVKGCTFRVVVSTTHHFNGDQPPLSACAGQPKMGGKHRERAYQQRYKLNGLR